MDDEQGYEPDQYELRRLHLIQTAKYHLSAWVGAKQIEAEPGTNYLGTEIDGELHLGTPIIDLEPCFCGNPYGFGFCAVCNAQRRIMSQENIVVLKKSALKEICKRNEIRFSEEAFKSMNAIALEVLVAATEHARQGKRKTIKSQDFKPYHIKD